MTKRKPAPISEAVATFLARAGIAERVDQAAVIPDWPALVGPQIAAVTAPLAVAADGTLFVAVETNAWMTELSLMEPELLRALNEGRVRRRAPVRKIRWLLRR